MISYHGTDISSANNIVGPPSNVDVTKGRGELGRGFYLGENIALAAALAKGRFNGNGVVVKFDLNDSTFVKLNIISLSYRNFVWKLWKGRLTGYKGQNHIFNVDVVCAPFATIDFASQYKFESKVAQDALNFHAVKQIL